MAKLTRTEILQLYQILVTQCTDLVIKYLNCVTMLCGCQVHSDKKSYLSSKSDSSLKTQVYSNSLFWIIIVQYESTLLHPADRFRCLCPLHLTSNRPAGQSPGARCVPLRGTVSIGWTGNSALITQHNGQTEREGGRKREEDIERDSESVSECVPHLIMQYYRSNR